MIKKKEMEKRFPIGTHLWRLASRQDERGLYHFDIIQEGEVLGVKAGEWPYLTDYILVIKRSDGMIDEWYYKQAKREKPELKTIV